jgi:hypothetical protein
MAQIPHPLFGGLNDALLVMKPLLDMLGAGWEWVSR